MDNAGRSKFELGEKTFAILFICTNGSATEAMDEYCIFQQVYVRHA